MEAKFSKMISLNGTNYHIWRNKMKDLLFVTKLHLPVFTTVKPDGKTDEEWDFEHEQVCGFIRQYVDDNVYNHICNEIHARTLWSKLEQLYASKTGNNKLFYLTKLMQLKYKEGTSIADHLNEMQGILDQLSRMGINFDDEVFALMVLASLPESWETLKISITNTAPNGAVNMELVKSGILNEEMRRRSQTSSSSSQPDVLVTDSRGRSQSREQKPRGKSRGKSNRYANIECHHCKKKGHIKKFCRKFKNEQDVPSTNGDSTDLELVPPTPVPRQVGDEGQVDEPDEDDAPIEVGSEDGEYDVHQPTPTPVASPIPLRRKSKPLMLFVSIGYTYTRGSNELTAHKVHVPKCLHIEDFAYF
ncbi:hypothetical protein JRO89_XS07G0281800 [Xanthoceras sorbifolium]|uniref:CCHC-type domain-containing protein n=1 Tax=Xanthoceras sorbifolium TaxID=99658 RepID=A0ABQ8HVV3_9ROSI|nr:hypothetical protein JRO89_XS07G0281800 [Xanthoceras sorbifolium]